MVFRPTQGIQANRGVQGQPKLLVAFALPIDAHPDPNASTRARHERLLTAFLAKPGQGQQ